MYRRAKNIDFKTMKELDEKKFKKESFVFLLQPRLKQMMGCVRVNVGVCRVISTSCTCIHLNQERLISNKILDFFPMSCKILSNNKLNFFLKSFRIN